MLYSVVLEMTQFQTIVSGFIQHIEGISTEVEKEKLKVSKLCMEWHWLSVLQLCNNWACCRWIRSMVKV